MHHMDIPCLLWTDTPNLPILCHLATQLSPGDIIATTLATRKPKQLYHRLDADSITMLKVESNMR